MHLFAINELAAARRGGRPRRWWQLVDVQFFIHRTPRLILLCRLFGHRPRVDGTQTTRYSSHRSRWIACARCGVRGAPQGALNPDLYDVGDVYPGPWRDVVAEGDSRAQRAFMDGIKPTELFELPDGGTAGRPVPGPRYYLPGPIESRPTGALGGQLVIGGWGGPGFELKVGNAGSEHTLAARFSLGRLGALYLHTQHHGQGVQRWLNPTGYESKVISLGFARDRLVWRWWVGRDTSYGRRRPSGAPSWWRDGDLRVIPPAADWLFGKRFLDRAPAVVADPDGIADFSDGVHRVVRLPDGDYLVKLRLEQVTAGRRRGRRWRTWEVDWEAAGKGLPTEAPGRGRYFGSSVTVRDEAVRAGTWAAEAAAAIAVDITNARTREGWEPSGHIKVKSTTGAAR